MTKRQSNIELLRIFSMLLIIAHHFAVHGGFVFYGQEITGNMLFLQALSIGGKIGVNLFVMISGYFMVTASSVRAEKGIKLWGQIFIYSVVIFLTAWGIGLTEFTLSGLLGAIFPVISNQWWFASTYFILYLLSPAINRILTTLPRKRYLVLLVLFAVFCCVVPVFQWLPERIRDLIWFLFLYSLSGYLRLYEHAARKRCAVWLTVGIGAFAVTFCYAVIVLGFYGKYQTSYQTVYFHAHQPLILLTSLFLFKGFLQLKLGNNAVINKLAALSFGIYLIHDSNYFRYPLWQGLLRCAEYADSAVLIPYAAAVIFAVYLVCAAIEALRLRLLDKLLMQASRRLAEAIPKRPSGH